MKHLSNLVKKNYKVPHMEDLLPRPSLRNNFVFVCEVRFSRKLFQSANMSCKVKNSSKLKRKKPETNLFFFSVQQVLSNLGNRNEGSMRFWWGEWKRDIEQKIYIISDDGFEWFFEKSDFKQNFTRTRSSWLNLLFHTVAVF